MIPVNYRPEGSAATLQRLLSDATDEVLFLADPRYELELQAFTIRRMIEVMAACGAGLVYADSSDQSRIDYQSGSLRDDFEFGPLIAVSVPRARETLKRHGPIDRNLRWGAMYDLRLKSSIDYPIVRIPEPLYAAKDPVTRSGGERHFELSGFFTGGLSGRDGIDRYEPSQTNRRLSAPAHGPDTADRRRVSSRGDDSDPGPQSGRDNWRCRQ